MTPDRLVSVIIPTYNRAHLICDALDSVLSQTHRPLEVIVVDDGSSDDTAGAIQLWKSAHNDSDTTIHFIEQDNRGGNAARNAGISAANGEYIAFLDSDDCWHPDKTARQLALLTSQANVGAVYCGVQHLDLSSNRLIESARRSYPQGALLNQLLVHDITAPTSAYLLKKEVFQVVGPFDEALQARQDWDMWIRVASQFHIAAVPQVMVDLREHTGPRTASDPQRELKAYSAIMCKYEDLRKSMPWRTRQAAMSAYYRRTGRVLFHRQLSRSEALAYYLRALLTWPFAFDNYAALLGWFLPKGPRATIHRCWNKVFGSTRFSIRSH